MSRQKWDDTLKMNGTENAYVLHKELGEWMTNNVTVVRYNDRLKETDAKIVELLERYENINIDGYTTLVKPRCNIYASA